MTDTSLVEETVDRLLREHGTSPTLLSQSHDWDHAAWQVMCDSGLHTIGIAEESGGAGGTTTDALAVARVIARAGAALPFADSSALAGWALARGGVRVPDGVLCFALLRDGTTPVHVADVAWASVASHAVLVTPREVGVRVDLRPVAEENVKAASDPSGEQAAHLAFDSAGEERVCSVEIDDLAFEDVELRLALVRCAQMTGALDALLPMTVEYARDRNQFGKPIASFQAVKHLLARLAGEVLAAGAAFDLAICAHEAGSALGIAAAKSRIGEAATKASRIAHQVHGAIGFTEEHALAAFTRRLWRWRDDGGDESAWSEWLGQRLADDREHSLWSVLTSLPGIEDGPA
jgi:acyl-CoA dehydrogenase